MRTKDKQNQWGKFLLFFSILFFLIQAFSYIPRQTSDQKNGNFWPYFYQEIPENSLDIVFMGNSHSKTTFIPEIIDKLLGTRSIHVNTSGESIYQTIYEYKEVLRYQDPKMVVLETFPIYAGLTQEELKPWNFSFFYSMPFSLRKLIYSHQFFSDGDLLKFYLPYTSNHADWKNPGLLISRVKDEVQAIKDKVEAGWHVDLPHQGYENYLKSLLPHEKPSKSSDAIASCPTPDLEKRLSVTEDILRISRKDSEGLLFIEAPQYINKHENCRDQTVDLIERYDISYETLLKDQDRSLLWFGDDQHMTQFGAIIATVETAQILADQLNIGINRDMLAYYQSYFFRDYTLVQEGDTITLNLIPENVETIQDVNFTWNVSLNNESILKIEEKGKNKLNFTLPEPTGNYFIHIVIHNPAGNYYLRGGFDLVLE
ncbi:MAG: hypothetical protein Q7J07_06200 [Pelolinea sp.]|nr:hypothetical protein [Pelolinea sp.]